MKGANETKTYWRHAFKNTAGEECVGVQRFLSRADADAALASRVGRDLYVVESQERS